MDNQHTLSASQGKPAQREPQQTTSTPITCGLFKLPAEIRNIIYCYALVTHKACKVGEEDHNQPALLRTCRQIRTEAIKIYYDENDFELGVHSLRFGPQLQHWLWKTPHLDRMKFIVYEHSLWSRMKVWLRLVQQDTIDFQCFDSGGGEMNDILDEGLRIAKEGRGRSWEVVERELEIFRLSGEPLGNSDMCPAELWEGT